MIKSSNRTKRQKPPGTAIVLTVGVFGLLLGCESGHYASSTPETPPRPNVVVILVDDLGYSDLSCQGAKDFTTPHIDALAESGVRLTQGYVSHPYCSPSRAGILTGRYQQRFGHEHNPRYDEEDDQTGTDVNEVMLPQLLTDAGYATAHIGKWHVGAGQPFRPLVRGYEEFFGFLGGGHDYFVATGENEYRGPLWRGAAPTEQQPTYLTDDLTNEALDFIDRHHERPFFLLLAYNAPHSPDQATEEYLAKVSTIPHPARRKYAALIQGIDAGVGRIQSHLQTLNLTDNTLVVFLSDNGGRRGSSDNRPLRGNKGWLHEGGVRVPFILSWPAALPANTTYDNPILALDILPTALSAADINTPTNLDGTNILPHLQGNRDTPPHTTIHWRVCGGLGWAIRHNQWKLVQDIAMETAELYDLSEDIGEDHDLASQHPEIARKLLGLHQEWHETLRTPAWTEGHADNTTMERTRAREAGTRQFPMPWRDPGQLQSHCATLRTLR